MMQPENIEPILKQGLAQFDLQSLTGELLQYLILLNKWNKAYNLTAVRDSSEMVSKHILDSLAILPWIKGPRVLDVGTGAGLPGIPLAIAKPELQIVLLDSNGKKVRFLQTVVRELQLKNVSVVQFRVENYHPSQAFDTVVSRAFSNLDQMIQWTKHLIAQDGIWLAMKGRYPDTELKDLQYHYRIESYAVSGLTGDRCCVLIDNSTKE